jgi:tryptophan halogenase
MITRILVVGGGSAGFLAAISLKLKIPDLLVTVVRSKDMGVIGVRDAITFAFPNYLHGRLRTTNVPLEGLEPPTGGLEIRCSIQLSYRGVLGSL